MKRKSLLSQSLFLGVILFSLSHHARAGEILPDIEARRFTSAPIQKSKTGRVYLFKATPQTIPNAGAILLFHNEQKKPIFAFRVIRADAAHSEYVAKKIRRYDQTGELTLDKNYTVIEKVADVLSAPQTEESATAAVASAPATAAPVTAIAQNTAVNAPPAPESPAEPSNQPPAAPQEHLSVESFEADLDASNAPAPLDSDLDEEEDLGPRSLMEVEEPITLNPFEHSLGAMIGSYRNMSNFNTGGESFGGFTLQYGFTLDRDVFVIGKSPQDSLNLEFGFGYYSVQNAEPTNDQYSMMPLMTQLRYDLQFTHNFALLFYGGIQYNYLMSETNGIQASRDAYQGVQPTLGLGMLFTLGPHWYLRTDLGWDKIALGLTVQW